MTQKLLLYKCGRFYAWLFIRVVHGYLQVSPVTKRFQVGRYMQQIYHSLFPVKVAPTPYIVTALLFSWENSGHFATLPLVSPRDDVREKQKFHNGDMSLNPDLAKLVFLIGCAARKICFNQYYEKHYPYLDSDKTNIIMEILCSFLFLVLRGNLSGGIAKCQLFS